MKKQPLSSSEQSKIFIFWLLMLPSVIFIVGIIPTLFLGFGLYMMRKNKDFSHVTTAVRNVRWYVSLCLVGSLIFSIYCATTLNENYGSLEKELWVSLIWSVGFISYLFFMNYFFVNPLFSHSEWIEIHGIFETKFKINSESEDGGKLDIIKGEMLKQYSVADELMKWAKLKEDGHISEEEFKEARDKLLKRS